MSEVSRGLYGRMLTPLLGRFITSLILVVGPVLLLEAASRIAHLGTRPAIPNIVDDDLNARMPPHFDAWIRLSGHPKVHYCTDGLGLRRSTCDRVTAGGDAKTILGVGDSQVLGWGLDFHDTYTSRAARADMHADDDVQLLAAAASDPESLRSWAREYRAATHGPIAVKILTLNLGNDLDEMYFRGLNVAVRPFKRVSEWLSVHSFFMLDFSIVKNALLNSEWTLPPGANPVVFTLDAGERDALVRATVDALVHLDHALPEATHTVVVILPQDYQVDVSQFKKYRRFYSNDAVFRSWSSKATDARIRLDTIDDAIVARLRESGYQVVDPRGALRAAPVDQLFDGASHHYRDAGQKIIGEQIAAAVKEGT